MVVEADYDIGVTIRVGQSGKILNLKKLKILETKCEELGHRQGLGFDEGFIVVGLLQDKIIPRAVDWFLGQVDDDSDFEDYDLNDEEL